MKSKDHIVFGVLIVIIIVALVLAVASKKEEDTGITADSTTTTEQETPETTELDAASVQELDVTASTIQWEASKKIIKTWVDAGTLQAQSATLNLDDKGDVIGGSIIIDMTSIKATQTGKNGDFDRLASHLSSEDFFDVVNYPTARFDVTAVGSNGEQELLLIGDMTIKDTTVGEVIPATVAQNEDGSHTLKGAIEIDRTEFDIRYGSDKFFDNLGDNVIDDVFTVTFDLTFSA